ncbi:hypothetical protein M514_24770, partial [Trichuris suis]
MELDVCTIGIMKENKWIKKMNVMKLLTDEKVLKKREMMKKWYESINEEDLKHSRKNILKNNGKIPEFTLKREQQRTQVETGDSQQDKGKQKHVSQRQKRSKSEAQ